MDGMPAGRGVTVLADPTRARILRLILDADDGRLRVGQLADALGLRQPTVSHHMRALHDDGIVTRHPDGRRVWYTIAPEQRDRVTTLLGAADHPADPDLERIVADLTARYRGVFSPETVDRYVRESHELLSHGSRSTLVASRTAAFAVTRLDALSRAHGEASDVPEVLFVCVQNAGRSQLAAAIMRQLAGERVRVRSAGSRPADDVKSTIVDALDEIGVGIGAEFPKPLTEEAVRAANIVVTMGCGDACPIYPGRRYIDWELDDPVGKPLAEVRVIRDRVDALVRALLADVIGT